MAINISSQDIINSLISTIILIILFKLSYEYYKYYNTNEYQEYKLFNSEYNKYTSKKTELKNNLRQKKEAKNNLINKLSDQLLDKELKNTPIQMIVNAWGIGERTADKLYHRGFKTLKDIDNFFFRRYTMPDYVGEFRFNRIKSWYNIYKENMKKKFKNEINRGDYSNTQIGEEIESINWKIQENKQKIEQISEIIKFFDIDKKRYELVTFYNYLRNKLHIPVETISELKLQKAELVIKDLLQLPKILQLYQKTPNIYEKFFNECKLLKNKYQYCYTIIILENKNNFSLKPLFVQGQGISKIEENFYKGLLFER